MLFSPGIKCYKKRLAFSLIELLVVIAILGVLAALAVPSYQQYKIRAAVNNAYIQLSGLTQAINAYYDRHGSFPTSIKYGGATINAVANTGVSLPTIQPISLKYRQELNLA